jgi:predicted permease
VIVLGLGLGANVALHAVLQTVLLRPLPVPRRDRLVMVKVLYKGEQNAWPASHPAFEDLKAYPGPFSGMAEAVMESQSTLQVGGRIMNARIPMVGPGWFRVLGVRASLGRTFTAEEDAKGAFVTVLSHRLWRSAFRSDPGIVGRTLPIGRGKTLFTIVGVGPAGFEGLELGCPEDLWMPLGAMARLGHGASPELMTSRQIPAFAIAARLGEGASLAQAQAALDAASAVQARLHPETDEGHRFMVVPLDASEQAMLGKILPQRTLLLIASGLALLLAVVGASGLFAARAARREKELATRLALGAGRALVRPMILEALLLGVAAIPVALGAGLSMARRLMSVPVGAGGVHLAPALDGRILALGTGLSLAALLLAVLGPALKARRMDPAGALADHGAGRATRGGGAPFVAVQMALSLVLLCASSVALGAFRMAARTGFPVARRAFMTVDTSRDPGLPDRLLARLRQMPEVASATRGAFEPMEASRTLTGFRLGDGARKEYLPAALVGSHWFRTLGVPVVSGRDFMESDGRDKVILNESFQRRHFPDRSPIGRRLGDLPEASLEVVGVVKDHRMVAGADFHTPMVWLNSRWEPDLVSACILVEGRGSARSVLARLKEALSREDPGAEPLKLSTLEDHVAATLHQENQNLSLLGVLGLGSMMLACFSLWAALSLQLALRGREMGIRSALGAGARRLFTRIFALGARLVLAGLGAGTLLVLLLSRLAGLHWPGLPQVTLFDFTVALLALAAAALLACLMPALRAARVEPSEALRQD